MQIKSDSTWIPRHPQSISITVGGAGGCSEEQKRGPHAAQGGLRAHCAAGKDPRDGGEWRGKKKHPRQGGFSWWFSSTLQPPGPSLFRVGSNREQEEMIWERGRPHACDHTGHLLPQFPRGGETTAFLLLFPIAVYRMVNQNSLNGSAHGTAFP